MSSRRSTEALEGFYLRVGEVKSVSSTESMMSDRDSQSTHVCISSGASRHKSPPPGGVEYTPTFAPLNSDDFKSIIVLLQ